jgi:hypothetical protein
MTANPVDLCLARLVQTQVLGQHMAIVELSVDPFVGNVRTTLIKSVK